MKTAVAQKIFTTFINSFCRRNGFTSTFFVFLHPCLIHSNPSSSHSPPSCLPRPTPQTQRMNVLTFSLILLCFFIYFHPHFLSANSHYSIFLRCQIVFTLGLLLKYVSHWLYTQQDNIQTRLAHAVLSYKRQFELSTALVNIMVHHRNHTSFLNEGLTRTSKVYDVLWA